MKRGYGAYGARWNEKDEMALGEEWDENWSEDELARWEEWEEKDSEDDDLEHFDLEKMSAEEWEYWTSLKESQSQAPQPASF